MNAKDAMNARGLRDLTPLPFCFVLFALSAVDNLTAKYAMNAKDFDKIRVSIKYLRALLSLRFHFT